MVRKRLLLLIAIITCLLSWAALAGAQGVVSENTPDNTPGSTLEATPTVFRKDTLESTPKNTPENTPKNTPEATPTPEASQTPESTPENTPEATPTPEASQTPENTPESTPEATPEPPPEAIAWTVWTYEQSTGQVTLVNSAGEIVLDFVLQMPYGYDTYPADITVSPDGALVAYSLAHSVTGGKRLIVSDWRTGEVISINALTPMWVTKEDSVACERIVFHETDENLALGYSQYHPDWQFSVGEDGELVLPEDITFAFAHKLALGRWEIIVYDPLAGEALRILSVGNPAVAAAGIERDAKQTPIVQRYRDNVVTFILVPDEPDEDEDGDEGESHLLPYEGYTWDMSTNTICPTIAYGALPAYTDTLPATGEVIMALADAQLPNHQDDFSDPQRNALYIYDPALDAIYPFYNTPYYSLVHPQFIQNGERILFGVADRSGKVLWWRVINRDGEALTEYTGRYRGDVDLLGVPDGYVALEQGIQGEAYLFHQVTSHRIRGFTADMIWYEDSIASPCLIWEQSGIEPPADFDTPWAQLAEPIYIDSDCLEPETGGES